MSCCSAGSTVTILTARQPGEQQAPKLRLKKLSDGTLELSLRDSEAAAAATAAAAASAQPGGVAPGALAAKVWAWPLPLVGLQDWVPYETLLRSILAAQPLQQLQQELQKGVALRLTKSSVTGVSLIHFDMELAGPVKDEAAVLPADVLLDMDSKWRGLAVDLKQPQLCSMYAGLHSALLAENRSSLMAGGPLYWTAGT